MATLKLDKTTGNTERYKIQVTVKAGHATLDGNAICRIVVLSNGTNQPLPCDFTPGEPDTSTLDADLLAEIVTKVDEDKKVGSTIDKTYSIHAEYWMGDAHGAIEDEIKDGKQVAGAYAHYRVNWPADGPVAAHTEDKTAKIWKPSDVIKTALLMEAGGAVTTMMA